MDIEEIAKELTLNIPNENIYINELMSKHTTFKIGGPADIFIKTYSAEEIKYIVMFAQKNKIPLKIIGNGSNLLVRDEGIRGIVVAIKLEGYTIVRNENYAFVTVESGMLNAKLAQILLKEGIEGFEFASGIPGTIGGAIKMNAGAYDSEIKDIIDETTYIDLTDLQIKKISKEEQKFSYRHSIFMEKDAIILNTRLILKYGNQEEIKERMQNNLNKRKMKQPIDMPSAGSTFKRGTDFITAKLIDECGLKGKRIGDAEVSDKHAGFIVNKGNATANDVIKLIEVVKKTVLDETGQKIELEIEIVP